MLTSKTNNWYAIYTRAKAEKKVYEQLKCSGYEAYLPLTTTYKQWSDRKKKIKTPLISSYVFIKIEEEKLNRVLSVYGTVRILKYLGKNAVVKDQEIESLKLLLNSKCNVELAESYQFSNGEQVNIVNGPLSGLNGVVIKGKNKNVVFVRIKALNSYIRAEIPAEFIKKALCKSV